MAGVGIYGIFYAKALKTNGSVTGYTGGTKMLGEAIDANFEHNESDDNPLHANDRVVERDASGSSGGTLTHTTARVMMEATAEIFGLEIKTVKVTVDDQEVEGKGFSYTGDEVAETVGVGYLKVVQENGVRRYEAVLFRGVDYSMPVEAAQTKTDSIEWITDEMTGTVMGRMEDGTPWHDRYVFPSRDSALAWIYSILGQPPTEEAKARINAKLDELEKKAAEEDE